MVQCGEVWCSVVQCGEVWCSVVQCGARGPIDSIEADPKAMEAEEAPDKLGMGR